MTKQEAKSFQMFKFFIETLCLNFHIKMSFSVFEPKMTFLILFLYFKRMCANKLSERKL